MCSRFFPRSRRDRDNAASLYGAIVAQARSPALYAAIGVPDSVGGRFEMVVLHMILVTRRLESGGEAARTAGQAVFDHFCRDMDNSLREMGVGDLSVPKRMREVGEAYFGRTAAYETGLAAADAKLLGEALSRTVFASEVSTGGARVLAAYTLAAARGLEEQDEQTILSDGPAFPDVDIFFSEACVE